MAWYSYVVIGWKFDIDIITINSSYGHLDVFVLFSSRRGVNIVNASTYNDILVGSLGSVILLEFSVVGPKLFGLLDILHQRIEEDRPLEFSQVDELTAALIVYQKSSNFCVVVSKHLIK